MYTAARACKTNSTSSDGVATLSGSCVVDLTLCVLLCVLSQVPDPVCKSWPLAEIHELMSGSLLDVVHFGIPCVNLVCRMHRCTVRLTLSTILLLVKRRFGCCCSLPQVVVHIPSQVCWTQKMKIPVGPSMCQTHGRLTLPRGMQLILPFFRVYLRLPSVIFVDLAIITIGLWYKTSLLSQ